jgi:hypothetical protein
MLAQNKADENLATVLKKLKKLLSWEYALVPSTNSHQQSSSDLMTLWIEFNLQDMLTIENLFVTNQTGQFQNIQIQTMFNSEKTEKTSFPYELTISPSPENYNIDFVTMNMCKSEWRSSNEDTDRSHSKSFSNLKIRKNPTKSILGFSRSDCIAVQKILMTLLINQPLNAQVFRLLHIFLSSEDIIIWDSCPKIKQFQKVWLNKLEVSKRIVGLGLGLGFRVGRDYSRLASDMKNSLSVDITVYQLDTSTIDADDDNCPIRYLANSN